MCVCVYANRLPTFGVLFSRERRYIATVIISKTRQNPRTLKVTMISVSLWLSPATLQRTIDLLNTTFTFPPPSLCLQTNTRGIIVLKTYLTTTPTANTIKIRISTAIHHKIRFFGKAITAVFLCLVCFEFITQSYISYYLYTCAVAIAHIFKYSNEA